MENETPQTIRLADYQPPEWLIDRVNLDVRLDPEATRITSRLELKPNPGCSAFSGQIALDGEKLVLEQASIDGQALAPDRYAVTPEKLVISGLEDRAFILELVTSCNPKANTELSGLYISNGIYCTQCEAEGFRRITYFLDRPDVMTRYRVRIEAPQSSSPVLLSNGNPVESGAIAGSDRHYAVWDDPFPKPSYLFALVAGDLGVVRDEFTTRSGRKVELRIYVEKGKEERCPWAMGSLKSSMRWDEEAYGREYDLDIFMIVAVPDFNFGAMENKGLNIFNDKYVLASPGSATDTDYVNIEAIIAHEYFHNWTGDRITCRDWFQLCLKEGLTVFRDQEFTSDLRSRAVKRIADVKRLRADQFPEDGGPLAHPVRPESYIEINNFYTATVYEKGAELCRMMRTLVGPDTFRKAMDLYFERHDGEAATVENLVRCVADASGRDMSQFFRWYEQAGTPEVLAKGEYDPARKTYALSLEQVTRPTPGQPVKEPLHMPLEIGLIGPDGRDLPLDLEGRGVLNEPLIELKEAQTTYRFRNVAQKPVLSLNRSFSAPIRLTTNLSAADQLFLIEHDRDPFNRWEAAQTVARSLIEGSDGFDPSAYAAAIGNALDDQALDQAFKAMMLGLPSEAEIAAQIGKDVDPDRVHDARERLRANVGRALMPRLEALWTRTETDGPYRPDPESTGRRALRYAVLHSIAAGDAGRGAALAKAVLADPPSMTDEIGALSTLVLLDRPERAEALAQFYDRHRDDHLLVDKWFSLHASVPLPATPQRVRELMEHREFKLTNPNRVRSLIATFAMANFTGFNAADGQGYEVVADTIIALDPLNPQVAARLATAFRSWQMFEPVRRARSEASLKRILAMPRLSRDTFEIVSKSLGSSSS
ncbi:MAG: aminopeptidase N [Hyphomicrobiales bacterium]